MNIFDLKSGNKILIVVHKLILATGIITQLYLFMKGLDKYLKTNNSSSFGIN